MLYAIHVFVFKEHELIARFTRLYNFLTGRGEDSNMLLVFECVSARQLYHCLIFLCQLLKPDEESTSTQRYIDSRTVQPKAKGVWISVDVTETIKDWVSDSG